MKILFSEEIFAWCKAFAFTKEIHSWFMINVFKLRLCLQRKFQASVRYVCHDGHDLPSDYPFYISLMCQKL